MEIPKCLSKTRKTCSRKCSGIARSNLTRRVVRCRTCGVEFSVTSGKQRGNFAPKCVIRGIGKEEAWSR